MTEPGTKALLIRIGRLEAAIQIQEEELDRLRGEREAAWRTGRIRHRR